MAKKFAPQYPSELRQNIGVYPRFLSAPGPALSPVHVLHVSSLATPQADDICRDILLQTIKLFCSNYDAPLTFTLQFVGYLIAAGKVGDRESEIGNDSPLQSYEQSNWNRCYGIWSNYGKSGTPEHGQTPNDQIFHLIINGKLHLTCVGNTRLSNFTWGQS